NRPDRAIASSLDLRGSFTASGLCQLSTGGIRLHGEPLPCGAQHLTRVRVRDGPYRLAQRQPHACGDSLIRLRGGFPTARFEEEEVTELVDELAVVPEVPVDDLELALGPQVGQPRLLRDLPQRRLLRRLAVLDMALRQTPVAVRVPDQEEVGRPALIPPVDHAARARFHPRAPAPRPRAARSPTSSTPPSHGPRARRSGPRWSRRPCAGCRPRSTGAGSGDRRGRCAAGPRARCPARRRRGARAPRGPPRPPRPASPRAPRAPPPPTAPAPVRRPRQRRVRSRPVRGRTSQRPRVRGGRGSFSPRCGSFPPLPSSRPRRPARWTG